MYAGNLQKAFKKTFCFIKPKTTRIFRLINFCSSLKLCNSCTGLLTDIYNYNFQVLFAIFVYT